VLVAAITPAAAAGPSLPPPESMAAVGDSITQAASTGGSLGADYPANSWSTGTNTTVNSHFLRLRALNPAITATNASVSGAKVVHLDGQMRSLASVQPGYLTVLIGGNDLCTDTVGEMTATATFEDQFRTAMTTLLGNASVAGVSPDTRVYVVSIPDVYQLWTLFKDSWWARTVWAAGDICQSLLANPTSTQQADRDRRALVRQRNMEYNTALAKVCAEFASRCHWDGNAAFSTVLARSDVSADYFHPSTSGQARLAATSWAAGYAWQTGNQAPVAYVHDVSGTAKNVSGRSWQATVTVTLRDTTGAAVANAAVSGTWSTGGGAQCTTGTSGTCQVTSGSLSRSSVPSVTFNVTGVSHATLAYDSSRNVESSITVGRP
jgi:lysophospholipase L1-like esterase